MSKIIKTGKPKKTEPAETAEASTSAAPPAVLETPAIAVPETSKPVDAEPESKDGQTPPAKATILSNGARQLAEKHGIEIPDWPYAARPPVGERVEKPIRMRVRRYCHVCQTPFGSEKVCPSSTCGHKRCVDCPRSPAAKSKTKTKPKEYDPYEGVTLPSKTGGQDLVYRKIRQRVHYKCHKCETDFAGQKVCGSCSHSRCKRCHREPSRKPKPETEVKRKKPIKWTCSECSTNGNVAKACAQCNHIRCVDCTREIPKRKKRAPLSGVVSDTDGDQGLSSSDIAKVTSALAATSIAS